MKNFNNNMRSVFSALALVFFGASSQAAGFQHGFVEDPLGAPLEIGVWYPSQTMPKSTTLGVITMSVALNGAVDDGVDLPLVVVSHDTGGSFLGHFDTAIALANAGYVVAAVTHRGDNYADKSRSVYIMDRPRQISRVIDHMLSKWTHHSLIDSKRIGMFGFSAGGFTALVSVGGVADFSKVPLNCRDFPKDFACQLTENAKQSSNFLPDSGRGQDTRVKAAVVAAPALGFVFSPDGLKNVAVPVQLWRPENDLLLPHPRYAEAVRAALPAVPEYHVVPKAGHFDFLAPCNEAFAMTASVICTSAPDFDRVAFHRDFNLAVVDFFGKTLK